MYVYTHLLCDQSSMHHFMQVPGLMHTHALIYLCTRCYPTLPEGIPSLHWYLLTLTEFKGLHACIIMIYMYIYIYIYAMSILGCSKLG